MSDSGERGLDALRERVHRDDDLARALFAVPPDEFTATVIRRAAELGYDVAPAELVEAQARGRRAWMLRWIE